jgi:hypothetical protein
VFGFCAVWCTFFFVGCSEVTTTLCRVIDMSSQ